MCLCVCVSMHVYVCISTATSLAWSHEVNPGGFHQVRAREGCPGQTSAVCVDAAAPEREALQPEREVGPVPWEVGGEEEGEEEVEVASPPCASCWTLLRPWRGVACDGPWSRYACVSGGFGWVWELEPGRHPPP